jgi:NADPH:quinone reductase-like Zn-dependent oxidoreductase
VLPVAVWCAQVFVAAGAGGVGHYAIQIAKAMGAAHVVTTASGPKIELVKSLGADTVVVRRCTVTDAVPAPRCLCDFA